MPTMLLVYIALAFAMPTRFNYRPNIYSGPDHSSICQCSVWRRSWWEWNTVYRRQQSVDQPQSVK